jgi:hypothetical protein
MSNHMCLRTVQFNLWTETSKVMYCKKQILYYSCLSLISGSEKSWMGHCTSFLIYLFVVAQEKCSKTVAHWSLYVLYPIQLPNCHQTDSTYSYVWKEKDRRNIFTHACKHTYAHTCMNVSYTCLCVPVCRLVYVKPRGRMINELKRSGRGLPAFSRRDWWIPRKDLTQDARIQFYNFTDTLTCLITRRKIVEWVQDVVLWTR